MLAYCTNVHAGAGLAQYWKNLETHALGVKRRFSPDKPMGIGLWFSANAARELIDGGEIPRFRAWLAEHGLSPFTFNAFPHGDFHDAVVKLRVYLPTWMDAARADYTMRIADIQHALLAEGEEGSISTLPIAWGDPPLSVSQLDAAAENLRVVARYLHALEERTGRLIHIAIEPEPGCVFTYSADIVRFFQEHLLKGQSAANETIIRRHLRVCHDVCHAAVMFEDQADVLRKYHAAGIAIAKFQISAAVRAAFDELPACGPERDAALDQLRSFNEPRYMHQTVVRRSGATKYYNDLPEALAAESDAPFGEWRTHFHVPIFLERFGRLQSTQDEIVKCLDAAKKFTDCRHYEVETYAWGVLPSELQVSELAEGIAREMAWAAERVSG